MANNLHMHTNENFETSKLDNEPDISNTQICPEIKHTICCKGNDHYKRLNRPEKKKKTKRTTITMTVLTLTTPDCVVQLTKANASQTLLDFQEEQIQLNKIKKVLRKLPANSLPDMGHQLEDMLLQCQFAGYPCDFE